VRGYAAVGRRAALGARGREREAEAALSRASRRTRRESEATAAAHVPLTFAPGEPYRFGWR
jgi:hypothetical protein